MVPTAPQAWSQRLHQEGVCGGGAPHVPSCHLEGPGQMAGGTGCVRGPCTHWGRKLRPIHSCSPSLTRCFLSPQGARWKTACADGGRPVCTVSGVGWPSPPGAPGRCEGRGRSVRAGRLTPLDVRRALGRGLCGLGCGRRRRAGGNGARSSVCVCLCPMFKATPWPLPPDPPLHGSAAGGLCLSCWRRGEPGALCCQGRAEVGPGRLGGSPRCGQLPPCESRREVRTRLSEEES